MPSLKSAAWYAAANLLVATAAFAAGSLSRAEAQTAAQVTFYEGENFQGRTFTTQQRVTDFNRYGFSDRASSAVVTSERWEVCDEVRFEGRCKVLRPGQYPSLSSLGMNDRISSARSVGAGATVGDSRYAPAPAPSAARVPFYEHEGYAGRTFRTDRPVENFQQVGFNDRASSVEVTGGNWEICDNAGYGGTCTVLRPGRYPSLATMGLNDRVSSVRELDANARVEDYRYAPGQEGRREFRRGNDERVYQADVTSVRAVVGTPEQRCWIEKEQVAAPRAGMSVPGAIAGVVIGGILGHQLGNGKGQDIATAGGAVAGGLLGANIGRLGGQPQAQTQDVQRCENVQSRTPTYWDVSYNFRGQDHRVQMTAAPGRTVTVNGQGEPRS